MKKHLLISLCFLLACSQPAADESVTTDEQVADQVPENDKIPVILDTDANNELDDQHAIAYLVFNQDLFDILGVTVNATFNGGDIEQHFLEAERVMALTNAQEIPLLKGANADFTAIRETLGEDSYDGKAAVEFMINEARKMEEGRLVLVPIGKLTNVALALEQAPDIADKIRIVWLGSNYPEPGEYNQINDTTALNYIFNTEVPFEMVTVRYGKPDGSDAVRVTPEEIDDRMKGEGPVVSPVTGRHGGEFTTFGDYSANLFSKIDLHGDPPSRALFDVVALAVLKNPAWGSRREIPAPELRNGEWRERPENPRTIIVWEDFDKQAIVDDFFAAIQQAE